MKELDLHGIRHTNVHQELDRLFSTASFPVVVITGHSTRMKELVSQVAEGYDLKTRQSISNPGRVVVYD